MNQNDDRLLHFLKNHRVSPPPAPAELEDRILQEIATTPLPIRRQMVIGTTLLLLFSGFSFFFYLNRSRQPILSAAEYEQLESSLVRSWNASTARSELGSATFLLESDNEPQVKSHNQE